MAQFTSEIDYTDPTTHKPIKLSSAVVKYTPAVVAGHVLDAIKADPALVKKLVAMVPAGPGGVVPAGPILSTGPVLLPQIPVGVNTDTSSWTPFGPGFEYNKPINGAAVHGLSGPIISAISGVKPSVDLAWQYNVVDSTQTPFQKVTVQDTEDSDLVMVPLPPTPQIEGTPGDGGDDHCIILDRATGAIYEFYAYAGPNGSAAVQVFDGTSGTPNRPYEMTSLAADGCSCFGGILTYDQAAAGKLNHALRTTFVGGLNQSKVFMPPASHAAGSAAAGAPGTMVFGMRMRLRADWKPAAGIQLSPMNQTIINCLKTYGVWLCDNSGPMGNGTISCTTDSRWNIDDLLTIFGRNNPSGLTYGSFEVVDTGQPMLTYYSEAVKGPGPSINAFTAKNNGDGTMTFNANVSGGGYHYVQNQPYFNGSTLTVPYAPGTYTLVARNQFATSTATCAVG